ncbi:hypothetical protein KJ966_23005 [bacterium]|nr:hypothetical protein [bacterium]
MEFKKLTSKAVRQRLGSIQLDLHYKPETVFAVEKPGADDYSAILCNAQWLRDQGVEIPALEKSKPDKKSDSKKK